MTPKPLEKEVQTDVLKWLNECGFIWAWRRNVGAMPMPQRGGSPRWVSFGQKGMSDVEGVIILTLPGDDYPLAVHLEVEVKRPGQKPTPHQMAWLAAHATAGSVAVWADSVPVLEEKLRQHFRRRGWPWPGA